MKLTLLLLAEQAIGPAYSLPAFKAFDLAAIERAPSSLPALTPRCSPGADGTEVVVSGSGGNHYRLPFPIERQPGGTGRDLPGGMAALTPTGPCGIFAGERRCRNTDKAEFGYGRGRDPLTVLSRLVKKVTTRMTTD